MVLSIVNLHSESQLDSLLLLILLLLEEVMPLASSHYSHFDASKLLILCKPRPDKALQITPAF